MKKRIIHVYCQGNLLVPNKMYENESKIYINKTYIIKIK